MIQYHTLGLYLSIPGLVYTSIIKFACSAFWQIPDFFLKPSLCNGERELIKKLKSIYLSSRTGSLMLNAFISRIINFFIIQQLTLSIVLEIRMSHLRPALMNLIKTWSRTVFRPDLYYVALNILRMMPLARPGISCSWLSNAVIKVESLMSFPIYFGGPPCRLLLNTRNWTSEHLFS